MGLADAIYTSMSAMDAMDAGISTVGNNLANISTSGYKEGHVQFGDVLNSVLGQTSPDDIGSGVDVQAVTTEFTDGSIQNTDNPLNFAITGSGFFTVDDVNHGNEVDYTRAGAFSLDKNGNIVDPSGDILQGYLADASGNIGKTLTNLNVSADLTASVNGSAPAGLTGFSLQQGGILDGSYDNGQEIPLAQVALTKFNAPGQLANAGNNLYAATDASGKGAVLTPGEEGAGTVMGSALEASNVNEDDQFGQMISLQQAFQMNSTVMQSADTEYTNMCNMTI